MVNRVSSWIEFPVLSETARDALVSLFTDVPETEKAACLDALRPYSEKIGGKSK